MCIPTFYLLISCNFWVFIWCFHVSKRKYSFIYFANLRFWQNRVYGKTKRDIKKRRADLRHWLKIVKTCTGHIGLYLRVLLGRLKSALRTIKVPANWREFALCGEVIVAQRQKFVYIYIYIYIYIYVCVCISTDLFTFCLTLRSKVFSRQYLKVFTPIKDFISTCFWSNVHKLSSK